MPYREVYYFDRTASSLKEWIGEVNGALWDFLRIWISDSEDWVGAQGVASVLSWFYHRKINVEDVMAVWERLVKGKVDVSKPLIYYIFLVRWERINKQRSKEPKSSNLQQDQQGTREAGGE